MLFDTHCHLNSDELYPKYKELIKEAKDSGVELIIVPGYDLLSSQRVLELIKEKNIYGAIGLQPEEIDKTNVNALFDLFKTVKDNKKIVAIGEIGLDYYWEKDENKKQVQRELFIKQIEIANELKLPIIVHSRDALQDTYEILKCHQPIMGGVMHCYSGPKEMVNEFIKLGMYISLGGPVTFKNARVPKEVATSIDINYLLIETDSPYLSPHPLRGTENKPSNVKLVEEEIARLRNMELDDLEAITFKNATKLFGIKYEDKM
ncbi:MAG: TatD family hydrolase [Erysipelotrichales bacterium]|nr:TatD family hydrolase [Erysipelotrichales bacterium]